MSKDNIKTIDREIACGRQDVNYFEVVEYSGEKLRIEIKSDSYLSQCFARIMIWSDRKWNFVDSIHHNNMSTPEKLVYRMQKATFGDFVADRDRLVKKAVAILS